MAHWRVHAIFRLSRRRWAPTVCVRVVHVEAFEHVEGRLVVANAREVQFVCVQSDDVHLRERGLVVLEREQRE